MTAHPIRATVVGDHVTMPRAEFERLLVLLEEAEDIAAFDGAQRRIASGEDELLSSSLVDRLLKGGNPVLVWREYRGLTQDDLAAAAGVSADEIRAVEAGGREPTVVFLKAVGSVLRVALDDLV